MNWELAGVLGIVAGLIGLAFMYARAVSGANRADTLEALNAYLDDLMHAQRDVLADKEQYIRELEKTVLGSLPAGQLASRLNLLFAEARSREAGTLPASQPKAGSAKP